MSPTKLLIWIHGQPSQPESQSSRQQQSGIQRAGTVLIAEQISQQRQQWIAWLHAPTQFSDGSASVPGLIALQQHRAIRQPQPSCVKVPAQNLVGPTVHNLQVGKAAEKLASEGKAAAEEAAAVVDEGECHQPSLSCFVCLLWL